MVVDLRDEAVERQRVAQARRTRRARRRARPWPASSSVPDAEREQRAGAHVVARDHRGIGMIGTRRMEHALDRGCAARNAATFAAVSQRRACLRFGLREVRDDAARAIVVEDAAAHRDQIHDLVADLGVVRRDVAAERGVLAAERLRHRLPMTTSTP